MNSESKRTIHEVADQHAPCPVPSAGQIAELGRLAWLVARLVEIDRTACTEHDAEIVCWELGASKKLVGQLRADAERLGWAGTLKGRQLSGVHIPVGDTTVFVELEVYNVSAGWIDDETYHLWPQTRGCPASCEHTDRMITGLAPARVPNHDEFATRWVLQVVDGMDAKQAKRTAKKLTSAA